MLTMTVDEAGPVVMSVLVVAALWFAKWLFRK